MKKIFIICSIRNAPSTFMNMQKEYVSKLEHSGNMVYFPPRDTDQSESGLEICKQNLQGINWCDEVHIFYRPESQGTHFDIGMAFALNKPVVPVNITNIPAGKSFERMLMEWKNS